ncbi:MAG: SLC45 family MFS transporter [Pseudanabaena sp. SU_2_4]|nr:SLC45 family MFS transporter [Pseudanabaena sp. SU_2_4]
MNVINLDRKILWKQVGGLASMLAAIVFCWMAYEFYQPQILRNLGFLELATWLGVIQGILAAGVEPVVGSLSDRIMRIVGSRLPIIAVGVTLAGAIFVIVSGLLDRNLPEGIRWLVPGLMTLWVIAMIVFRGPAIAILQQLAPTEALPQANALLVFVFALAGACHPMINLLLKNVGAGATFIGGALVLLVGATLLWASSPKRLSTPTQACSQVPASILSMVLTFAIGIGAGIEVNLMMAVVPRVLSQGSSLNLGSEYIASLILSIAAIATFPLGQLVTKLGGRSGMVFGLSAVTIGIVPILLRQTILGQNLIFELVHILIAGVAFGMVFISMIPFALSMLSNGHEGLATGLYFGGGGLATALLNGIAQYFGSQIDRVEAGTAVLVAFVTLPIAIGCIAAKRYE